MIQKMLRTITAKNHLNAITIGEYAKMKVGVMKFQIWAFHAEGLGHVSAMQASGMFGLMKMDTLIINPTEKDMPLFSYDRVHAMGNDTLIYELYDTILEKADLNRVEDVKEKYRHLPDHDLGEHWYDSIKLAISLSKKGKKVHTAAFDACAMEYLAAYLEEDTLRGMELLGNSDTAPGIVKALGCKNGRFQIPGTDMPFAMIHKLTENAVSPGYFGFSFD